MALGYIKVQVLIYVRTDCDLICQTASQGQWGYIVTALNTSVNAKLLPKYIQQLNSTSFLPLQSNLTGFLFCVSPACRVLDVHCNSATMVMDFSAGGVATDAAVQS